MSIPRNLSQHIRILHTHSAGHRDYVSGEVQVGFTDGDSLNGLLPIINEQYSQH